MKISILLPYKENYSKNYAGAVSIFVNEINKISVYFENRFPGWKRKELIHVPELQIQYAIKVQRSGSGLTAFPAVANVDAADVENQDNDDNGDDDCDAAWDNEVSAGCSSIRNLG